MISWMILLVGALVTAFLLIRNRKDLFKKTNEYDDFGTPTTKFWSLIATFVVFVLISLFQPYALDRVDAGHVGIKVNLTGDSRGVSGYSYKTGWVTYNTWTEQLYEFPTYQQHIEYPNQQVITRGGFSATIKPTFNYSLIPTAVGDMFQNLRVDIQQVEQGWLRTAIVGAVNDVANRWAVDHIFEKREEFEAAIVAECNKRVSKWFTVSQLRTNIVPPPSLQKAIEAKTNAIQQVQVAENNKKVIIAQGQTAIAKAKADSAQAVITASGLANAKIIEAKAEAEAVRFKQIQLTPLYIDYIRAQAWNGVLPSTVLGSSNALLNLK